MSKVKTSPAVVTIVATLTTLALVLLALTFTAAPARAQESGTTAKALALSTQSTSIQSQVSHLTKQVRSGHRGQRMVKRVVRVNRSMRSLSHSLTQLNRVYLAMDQCDTGDVQTVIASSTKALSVAKSTLKLDRRLSTQSTRRASTKLSTSASTLTSATKKLRRKKWTNTPTPTPTATATATATPTPTASATATATPTPTPTATTTSPDVPEGYTLVQNTTINNLATDGLHDVYYYNVTFTGGSSSNAVLTFQGTSYNLIFDNVTVASGGGWNGVSINDAYGRIHDITFKNSVFESQGRMGIEITSRPTSATTQYHDVNILNSTIEPQGNEAVSYDGGAAAGSCTFSGNLIKGAGNDPAQDYGNGLEINGPSNFTVTGNTIWQTRGSAFNFQRHVTDACGWVVSNNVIDASHQYQSTAQSSLSQQVLMFNVYGGAFSGNTVISASPGGSVAYISNSHDMDWRTSTWKDASNRTGYQTPKLVDGCSGNQF